MNFLEFVLRTFPVRQVGVYIAAGALGLCANVGSFYLLLHAGVAYLIASSIAIAFATVVGFMLQKYWTFRGATKLSTAVQFVLYAAVMGMNLGINALLVYGLVQVAEAHPLLAQTLSAGVLAVISFCIYKYGIFRPGTSPEAPL